MRARENTSADLCVPALSMSSALTAFSPDLKKSERACSMLSCRSYQSTIVLYVTVTCWAPSMTSLTPSRLSSVVASGDDPASYTSLKTFALAPSPSTSLPSGTNFIDRGFGVASIDTEMLRQNASCASAVSLAAFQGRGMLLRDPARTSLAAAIAVDF